jgi:hypothetical protein
MSIIRVRLVFRMSGRKLIWVLVSMRQSSCGDCHAAANQSLRAYGMLPVCIVLLLV